MLLREVVLWGPGEAQGDAAGRLQHDRMPLCPV
jgi:hypothetical protein